MKTLIVTCGVLLIGTHTLAQRVPSLSVASPWYVSVQLSDHTYEVVVPGTTTGLSGTNPFQLTAGRWLTSRWAVEVKISQSHFLHEGTNNSIAADGDSRSRYLYAEAWAKSASALLRRRLTRNSEHRMQFDVLAGLTALHYCDQYEVLETANGQIQRQERWGDQAINSYLTLGPAISYRLGKHLDVNGEVMLNKNLHTISRTFSTQQLNSTMGFQRGWSLGLRYRFALPKKK